MTNRLYNWGETPENYLGQKRLDQECLPTTHAFEQPGLTVITEDQLLQRDLVVNADVVDQENIDDLFN